MLFIDYVGFCRRLPSRWRPLRQERRKNYLKTNILLIFFGFSRRLLLQVGGGGLREPAGKAYMGEGQLSRRLADFFCE